MSEIGGTYDPCFPKEPKYPYLGPFLVGKTGNMTFEELCALRKKVAEFNASLEIQHKALLAYIQDYFDGYISFPELVCSYSQIQQLEYINGEYCFDDGDLNAAQKIRLQYARESIWNMIVSEHEKREDKDIMTQTVIDASRFFASEFQKLCEKYPETYSKDDAKLFLDAHHPVEIIEKLQDRKRFFTFSYNESGDMVGYFESRQSSQYSDTQVVQWMFVSEHERRKGIARKMWQEFESWCGENGYKSIWSFVALRNDISHRVHEKLMLEFMQGVYDANTHIYVQGVPEK